jgi:hypothetical protein
MNFMSRVSTTALVGHGKQPFKTRGGDPAARELDRQESGRSQLVVV